MASITKRGKSYRVRINRRGYTPLTQSFKHHSEAKRWARNVESQIDQGKIKPISESSKPTVRAATTTFKEAAEHYLRTHTPLKRNHRSEAGIIKILITRWGEMTVGAINQQKVAALRDTMISDGLSGATVGHYLNAISVIYRTLADEWSLDLGNPTRGIKRPAQNPPRQIRLSFEARQFLEAVCSQSSEKLLLPIVRLALETGMRRGELMSLTWADIDLDKRRISIRRSKNGSARVIPISETSLQILEGLVRNSDQRLFPLGIESMRKHFERAVKRAAAAWTNEAPNPFRELRFHDLRHEALSHLSDRGLNVIELSQFSGHKTLSMLARYTHPDQRAVLQKINGHPSTSS